MKIKRMLALLLVICTVLSAAAVIDASAASEHINSFLCYIEPLGGGNIRIHFEVYGTGIMEEIGASRILLQQSRDGINWHTAQVFSCDDHPQMTERGTSFHVGCVDYAGEAGVQYRAEMTAYASDGVTHSLRSKSVDATAYGGEETPVAAPTPEYVGSIATGGKESSTYGEFRLVAGDHIESGDGNTYFELQPERYTIHTYTCPSCGASGTKTGDSAVFISTKGSESVCYEIARLTQILCAGCDRLNYCWSETLNTITSHKDGHTCGMCGYSR